MKIIILIGVLVCISSSLARDLIVGTTYNNRLVWHEKVECIGIPFKKRVKEVFYADPAQQIIKGIVARDADHREDSYATITSGGVGCTYANLRIKSERGSGLNYQIEFYA